MTPQDFEKLIVFAAMKNGDLHAVALKKDTAESLMHLIAALEGSISIIDKPIEGIKHVKKEEHDTPSPANS